MSFIKVGVRGEQLLGLVTVTQLYCSKKYRKIDFTVSNSKILSLLDSNSKIQHSNLLSTVVFKNEKPF